VQQLCSGGAPSVPKLSHLSALERLVLRQCPRPLPSRQTTGLVLPSGPPTAGSACCRRQLGIRTRGSSSPSPSRRRSASRRGGGVSRQRRREVDGVVQHGAEVAATGWRLTLLLRLRGMN